MDISIVNRSTETIEIIRKIINDTGIHRIPWVAENGVEAVENYRIRHPDLILLALDIPLLNGVQTIKKIMEIENCPILVVVTDHQDNSAEIFEAMGLGALDAVLCPFEQGANLLEAKKALLRKISMIGKLIGKGTSKKTVTMRAFKDTISDEKPPIVAIGSSTGGPKALAAILSQIPAGFPAAIVIIQHVDVLFAENMAHWLNTQTELDVVAINARTAPIAGTCYLAATEDHIRFDKTQNLVETDEAQEYPYHPSIDIFFNSLAENSENSGVALLLTGMGKDGVKGLLRLKKKGWHTIAQDKATSAVYGMPKAAMECGAAKEILPLDEMAAVVMEKVAQLTRKK